MTGGQLLGDHPSQYGIAKNGPHLNSCDAVEELQVCMSRWYFSRKEIEDYSPSRKDGIEFKKETELRKLYCSFLQDLGIKLKVPQVTIAAAMLLCHRFYLRQSHGKNAWQTMATVCMFLACKVEETPRLLMDVVVVSYEIMYKKNPAAAQRIKQKDVYEKQKELVILGERLLLATIGFDLNIPLPYKPLVAALKKMQISHNDIAKVAWNFLNDWLRTTLCLQYKPHYIAAGSMYLAAKFNKVKLPSERGNVWWLEFDVVPQQLEEVIQQMLGLLEENKRSVTPSSHEKTTQATVPPQTTVPVKNEQSKSSPSFGPSASVITSNSRDAICREDEGGSGSTSSKKGLLQNSQKLPCKDISVVRKEVLPSQTSDISVVREEVLPSQTSDISVVREEVLPSQTSDSGSSHSVVEDGEDRYNEGEVQATIIESNRAVEEDGDHKSPHEGHVQAPSIESNQVASAKIVSVSMGLSKTDQDRIREAIKRRKCERVPNKKVVIKSIDNDDLDDDDDSWIVRELENGLEEYASTEKRQRLVY